MIGVIEAPERKGFYLNELRTLGIVPKKTNEFNDEKELESLVTAVKEGMLQDYKNACMTE